MKGGKERRGRGWGQGGGGEERQRGKEEKDEVERKEIRWEKIDRGTNKRG